MEDKREQRPPYSSAQTYSQTACSEDAIDLVELLSIFSRQWKVICAITGLSFLGAVVYLFLAPPVYEAQAVVTQPKSKFVEALTLPGISQISSGDIYAKYRLNLKSSSLRQQFVAENPQLVSVRQQFANKSPQFWRDNVPKVTEEKKNPDGPVQVSLQGHDSKLVTDWVNGYILMADQKTIGDICDGIERKIVNQKNAIEDQLQKRLELAAQQRQDRITLLADHIAMAQALKIFGRRLAVNSTPVSQGVAVTLNAVQEPLYMRGVEELEAEKESLEKRKNDAPFIADYREKQESLALLDAGLKRLQEARVAFHAVTIDQPAIQDEKPVKPKRMLVLGLALVLGGIGGVLTAFVIYLVQQQKVQVKQ